MLLAKRYQARGTAVVNAAGSGAWVSSDTADLQDTIPECAWLRSYSLCQDEESLARHHEAVSSPMPRARIGDSLVW
jgi:hypothetical protein